MLEFLAFLALEMGALSNQLLVDIESFLHEYAYGAYERVEFEALPIQDQIFVLEKDSELMEQGLVIELEQAGVTIAIFRAIYPCLREASDCWRGTVLLFNQSDEKNIHRTLFLLGTSRPVFDETTRDAVWLRQRLRAYLEKKGYFRLPGTI
ncbi:MAG: hypothetical protein NZ482_01980 [Gloeomargarita sp. SKYG98]|nr:hypothetical protein [Gloeomargarita sp. SKYG98]